MHKFYFLFFLWLLSSKFCFAQSYDWRWARSAISNGPHDPLSEGYNVATDSLENLFVCGHYSRNITFGQFSLNQRQGSFIAKYDSSGNIKWAKGDSTLLTSLGASDAFGISADAFGNSYICGGFRDTVYFGSQQLIGSHAGSTFLVKYDSTGTALWARTCTDAQDAFSNSCAVDLAGNIYMTGTWGYGPTVTFGSHSLTNSNGNSHNVFLVKYDSMGNALWARSSETIGTIGEGNGVATDIYGNVYLTGDFTTPYISFGTDTIINASQNNEDIFLVKYDSTGNVLWVQHSGGPGRDFGWDVACDLDGNVLLASSINFPYSSLISKYDSTGNLMWSKGMTSNPSGQISCYRITTDIKSNVYASGGYYPPVDISGDTILQLPPSASDPLFIVKYDPGGHLLFAKGVSNGGDDQCGIAVTNSGYIYLGGDYTANTFIVGNDTLLYPGTGSHGEQIFTAKLICNTIQAGFISSNDTICVGPACINFTDNSMGNPTGWKWFFPGAIPDTSTQQNPGNICYANPGNYDAILIASNTNESDTLTLSKYITIYPAPAYPAIIQLGDTLFALPGFINYQWYDDTTFVNGVNNYYFIATHNGIYTVQVTDSNGCQVSQTLLNVIVATNEIKNGEPNFLINYFNGVFSIHSTEELPVDIKITDALGKTIYFNRINIKRDFTTINLLSSISSGIYLVSLSTSKEVLTKKIFIE